MSLNRYRQQRNWGARIHEYELKGMRTVFLENEQLRVGILADKGADLFEFNYKPRDMDFAWLTAKGIQNPTSYLSTSPDPVATFIDYYLGGWQEIFPNAGPPVSYQGALLGQHGEVSNLPWDYQVIEDNEMLVAVKFLVKTQKVPFAIEKVVRLRSGERQLEIEETIRNESTVPLHAMWGQHITFGQPFLSEGCRITLPAGVSVVPHDVPTNPTGRRVKAGTTYSWPTAQSETGEKVDLSVLPPRGTSSEELYLLGFQDGWYEIHNPLHKLGMRVEWDARVMPYMWFWQEFGATQGYPWYGRHYNVGLELFSSYPDYGLPHAVENNTALSFAPHETKHFSFCAIVQDQG